MEKPYVEGELLVKFKESVSPDRVREILRRAETEVNRFLRTVKVHVLKLPPVPRVEDMLKKFRTLPEVEYAEPNYAVTIQERPGSRKE